MEEAKTEPTGSEAWLSSLNGFTLPQILFRQAERLGTGSAAVREKAYGIWQTYNWREYGRYTRHTALGLLTLGLKRGENVGIITNNHPEWLFTELGAQAVGGITLNLFTSAVAKELATMLNRIEAAYVIVQDQEQVDKLLEVKEQLQHIRRVIYIDRTGMRTYIDDPWLASFEELLKKGEELDRAEPGRFGSELSQGKPEEIALMIMTSGTTGIPKLAMLSHQNFTYIARKWLQSITVTPDDNWISITPTAWIVDQMWGGRGSALRGDDDELP